MKKVGINYFYLASLNTWFLAASGFFLLASILSENGKLFVYSMISFLVFGAINFVLCYLIKTMKYRREDKKDFSLFGWIISGGCE